MQDRCKAEADRLVTTTRVIIAMSRADLVRLHHELATTRAFIDAMMRDLEDWRRACELTALPASPPRPAPGADG